MSREKPRFNYTGYGWEGQNYDRNIGIKEIAKKVRTHLRTQFPDCKFSVTIERYSGGQSMNISLMEAPFKAILKKGSIVNNEFVSMQDQGYKFEHYGQLNQYTFSDDYNSISLPIRGWNNGQQLSRKAWDVMKEAYKYAVSFNYDDSDAMIDYFHTNFYLHLNIGKWDKPFKRRRR